MARIALALVLALVLSAPAVAQPDNTALERSFHQAMDYLQAGNAAQAEDILREMLKSTDSARVKLELARALFFQGKYAESRALFQEVATRTDTPWRVRDNIRSFVRTIEDRTGYLKFGISVVTDSNPRNLAASKEFSVGGLQVTSVEEPEQLTGLRYAVRGWLPFSGDGRWAGYATASYSDYPGQDIDRLTVDAGVMRTLSETGALRGKAGMEAGTLAGERLYHFPYVGADAVLAESQATRLTAEAKVGKVLFPDYAYLDADYASAAVSVRRSFSQFASASLGGMVESSNAAERPYSYSGWDLGPGIDTFWPDSAFLIGARASGGSRSYEAVDPLFGQRRIDSRFRIEASLGNKRWRFRDNYVSLVASYESNDSSIDFFSYRKTNLSMVVE